MLLDEGVCCNPWDFPSLRFPLLFIFPSFPDFVCFPSNIEKLKRHGLSWLGERVERKRKGYVTHAGSNLRDATGEEDPALPDLEII